MRKIWITFDIENWLWKSEIGIFWSLDLEGVLIWQKFSFMKKYYFSLNSATIWCGNWWKILKSYLLNKYHALLWLELVTFMLIKSKHKRQTWIHKHLEFDGNSIDFCFGFQKQNRIWEKCVVHEMGTTSPWWLPLAISIDRWFSILGILANFWRKSPEKVMFLISFNSLNTQFYESEF